MKNSVLRISVVTACFWLAGSASAFNPQPDPPGFGTIGIVSSQMARLSVSNVFVADMDVVDAPSLWPPGPAWPPGPCYPPGPCKVELIFLDSRGGIVKREVKSVSAGQTAWIDLPASLLVSGTNRAQIRAVVNVLEWPRDPETGSMLADPFIATLEIWDMDTGKTRVVMSPGVLHNACP